MTEVSASVCLILATACISKVYTIWPSSHASTSKQTRYVQVVAPPPTKHAASTLVPSSHLFSLLSSQTWRDVPLPSIIIDILHPCSHAVLSNGTNIYYCIGGWGVREVCIIDWSAFFCDFLSDQGDYSFDLHFTRQNVNDYAWFDWWSPISQFTASMWIKTSTHPFTLFSFGNDSLKIQLQMESSNYVDLCIWFGPKSSCGYVNYRFFCAHAFSVPR